MRVWGLWYGGRSYSCPSIDDAEEFRSIRAAGWALEAREENAGGDTPCVEASEMHLFRADPRETGSEYPDMVLRLGPRGGIRRERC